MPRVREPQSDEGRVQLLSKVLITYTADAQQNDVVYLPATIPARITALLEGVTDPQTNVSTPGYRPAVVELTRLRAAVAKEVEDSDKAEVVLETYIRDFWEVLKRRTFRLGHPVAVLNYYDLPQDGAVPALATRADRQAWAQKILDGEGAALAASFPAMANPSVGDVSQKLNTAKTEAEQITPKDRAQELALEVVRGLRAPAIELVNDVLDELRHALRKMEPGTARNIMRSYGVEFELLPGEPPDPEVPPTDEGSSSSSSSSSSG